MDQLDDFKTGAAIWKLSPDGVAKVVRVKWCSHQAVPVVFEDATEFFHGASRHTPRCHLDETLE